jgi:hypothetical protein
MSDVELGQHATAELVRNDEGWWPALCFCGWDGGLFPSAEDAADALMQHAEIGSGFPAKLARAEQLIALYRSLEAAVGIDHDEDNLPGRAYEAYETFVDAEREL